MTFYECIKVQMEENLYLLKVTSDGYKLWRNGKPLLGRLDLELTERCNNNCIHCCINLPASDFDSKRKELTTYEIKEILKEAVSLGCITVRFTGGEPLLREDFKELYLFARRLGLKVVIFTNATLITGPIAELFSNIPPLGKIEVSVYGMSKKSYEAVTRTSGSFEAAWRGIDLLLQKNIPFIVKGAFLPPFYGEMEAFERWTASIPWMEKPPSYSIFFDLRCRRDSETKNRLIRKMRPSSKRALEFLTRRKEEYIEEMKEFCSKFMAPGGESLFCCGAGLGGGSVDAYGKLQPCLVLRHPGLAYDLKAGSLEDALRVQFPKLRQMKAQNGEYLARCANCFLKGLCEQCPGKSYLEHGTLDTPIEYLCEMAHTQARYLGLLLEGERSWEIRDWRERIRCFSGREPALWGEEGCVQDSVAV